MNYLATADVKCSCVWRAGGFSDAKIKAGYHLTFVICHIYIHLFYDAELAGELYDGNQPFGMDNGVINDINEPAVALALHTFVYIFSLENEG